LSENNHIEPAGETGVRKTIVPTDIAVGISYFFIVLFFSVLMSYTILSLTRGPYIGYKVPHYLITLVLATFLSTLVLIVAAVIKYTKRIVYALILSLISVAISFYLYEYYIILSRHLSILPLPCLLMLSNGTHTTYVLDLGQISLIIAVILAHTNRKRVRACMQAQVKEGT